MSRLRVYGTARTRPFRALWFAEEFGLAYEHIPVEIGDAGTRAPEFLGLNSNGRLPGKRVLGGLDAIVADRGRARQA